MINNSKEWKEGKRKKEENWWRWGEMENNKEGKKEEDWKNPLRMFNIKLEQMVIYELYMIHLRISPLFLGVWKKKFI